MERGISGAVPSPNVANQGQSGSVNASSVSAIQTPLTLCSLTDISTLQTLPDKDSSLNLFLSSGRAFQMIRTGLSMTSGTWTLPTLEKTADNVS